MRAYTMGRAGNCVVWTAVALAFALVALLAALPVQQGHADGPVEPGSGYVQPGVREPLSPERAQYVREKEQLARTWWEARQGASSVEWQAARDAVASFAQKYGLTAELAGVSSDVLYPTAGYSWNWLPVAIVHQQRSYWCGPASAYEILAYKGWYTSYKGQALSQSRLATSEWLATTTGGTEFGVNWLRTLNGWITNGQPPGWYELDWIPSLSELKSETTFDIDNYHPVVDDVHMHPYGVHLLGYPSSAEYWHYVVTNGYSSYGSYFDYGDSYDTGQGSWGPHDDYPASSMKTLVDDRGIVW